MVMQKVIKRGRHNGDIVFDKTGQLYLKPQFIKKVGLKFQFVEIYFDDETTEIGLKFSVDPTLDSYKLSNAGAGHHKQVGCRAFSRRVGFCGVKYKGANLRYDEENDMWVFRIVKIES